MIACLGIEVSNGLGDLSCFLVSVKERFLLRHGRRWVFLRFFAFAREMSGFSAVEAYSGCGSCHTEVYFGVDTIFFFLVVFFVFNVAVVNFDVSDRFSLGFPFEDESSEGFLFSRFLWSQTLEASELFVSCVYVLRDFHPSS